MDISLDKFFDGKIKIYQPKRGYKAGLDAILLAASVKTSKGKNIYDIGSGVGTISYCLGFRCNNVLITGVEKHIEYYTLAVKSQKLNKLKSKVFFLNQDFIKMKKINCDIIVSNPPWFKKNSTYKSPNPLLNKAKIESLNLGLWIKKVDSALNTNGEYYTIFPYSRVKDLINLLKIYFKIIKICPIASFRSKKPDRAIIYAKKTAKTYYFKELEKIIIHKGDKSFNDNISKILKKGSSLSLA